MRDLADELFVHLSEDGWQRLRTWTGKASIKSWVRIVARNVCGQMVKDWNRSIPLSDVVDSQVADGQESILHQIIESERCVEVLNAIETLDSARDQAVLRMFYFESKSPACIAAALGCPVDRVYVIKLRAVKRLQQMLGGAVSDVNASRR